MFAGALLDLGWPEKSLLEGLSQLGLDHEFHIHVSKGIRQCISGTKFDVHVQSEHDHHHSHEHYHGDAGQEAGHNHGRSYRDIREIILSSQLPKEVRTKAVAVFQRIATAEGKIHGIPAEDVEFHEVGAIDSIVDVVAVCLGLHQLGIQEVRCSRLFEGCGEIQCAHGTFPLPAPATLEILTGIPLRQIDEPMEFITPTGAALLAEFSTSFGLIPPMQIKRTGYGLGSRDPSPRPNVLRALLGCPDLSSATPDKIVEIQTNLDDITPELVGALTGTLFQAGALDVFTLPASMKQNRPGVLLVVLSKEEDAQNLARLLLNESTAFGVRMHTCSRLILDRKIVEVPTAYGNIQVKIGLMDGKILQRTPEFSSCQDAAERNKAPVRFIYNAALAASESIRESRD